ncbi:hypothetical protein GGR33_004255 [Methylobacterium brachythecii]|uniref:Uncharacterized protein n=1 Tax=Methylobacterium brachythecii TaxID=1176177 RepID=A0A7W6F8P7_9HYPH|nr:hypothetical protein [Methylobacterium brachythecii]GLS45594.1 hypothetical protein GCM10007884_35850 [Methylobacterium brachythecii]
MFADEVAERPYNKDVVTASLRHVRLFFLRVQTFVRTVAMVRLWRVAAAVHDLVGWIWDGLLWSAKVN